MAKNELAPNKLFYLSALFLAGVVISTYFVKGNFDARSQASNPNNTSFPIRIAHFYKPATNFEMSSLAPKLDTLILTRKDEAHVQAAKAAGFENPVLQYVIMDSMQGPLGLTNNQVGVCDATDTAFVPRSNQVANEVGEFCQVHDSIVNGTAFDHDLDSSTPAVVASEDWFLHNGANQRLGNENGGGFYYHLNWGNQQVREYFTARLLRELKGSPTHPATGMDGIFLDNVELSWNKKLSRLDVSGQPVEYSSSTAWATAVKDGLAFVYGKLHPQGYPVWGNLIENPRVGNDWAAVEPYLDGAMEESFALDWDGRPRAQADFERQLEQASWWMARGKYFLAVAQGTDNQNEARYGLASMLLVTDGIYGVYRHGDSSVYTTFWDYPEYSYHLGKPTGLRQRVTNTADVIWTRDFECGRVEVNVTQGTSNIETFACPGASPTATPSASPIVSSPTPAPSPVTDTLNPQVSITSPAAGVTLGSNTTIKITANASDNVGVTSVKFLVNGREICAVATAPYECNWKIAKGTSGTQKITVIARDAAGNAGQAEITVTVGGGSGSGGSGGGGKNKP